MILRFEANGDYNVLMMGNPTIDVRSTSDVCCTLRRWRRCFDKTEIVNRLPILFSAFRANVRELRRTIIITLHI